MIFSGCSSSNFTDDMKNHHHQQHQHHQQHHQHHQQQELLSDDQTKKPKKDTTTKTLTKTTGDGATIEVARRPRGRPPGSKNKPKPPLVITRDAEPPAAMRTHILEISTGHDIVDAIASFARRRSIGLCVLAGSGSVSNVTLRQPMQTPAAAVVVLRGRFEILSLAGSMLPPSLPTMQAGVSVSLAGPQGQVIGGMVAGPLLASGTVVVVAAGFENPSFNRLPEDNDAEDTTAVNVSPGGEAGEADAQAHHHHHHHHRRRHEHELNAPPAESCGMAMYSSDAIWAPTPRPPPPPPSSRY